MIRVLIVEDYELAIDLYELLKIDFMDIIEVTIINPQKISLIDILSKISKNNYDYLFLDHSYDTDFTGKDIAEKSKFRGNIYSISAHNIDIEYSHRHIGKNGLAKVFYELRQSTVQNISYA